MEARPNLVALALVQVTQVALLCDPASGLVRVVVIDDAHRWLFLLLECVVDPSSDVNYLD